MKKIVMVLGLLLGGNLMAEPTVTSVNAQQRYPWNGLVDITVTFAGSPTEVSQTGCSFVATNCATHVALSVTHLITVKAVAIYENGTMSSVAVASFALGQCPDPVIVSAGGETFSHGSVQVSIDWECVDGVLRYTTDGSDVTETSPEYAGAFAIDDTTTIKAKAFGETYFDSKQIELTVTREWEPVTTPLIAAAESFSGRKTMVSISCATEGATIRYTVDGSEPNSHSMRYSGAFEIREWRYVKDVADDAKYPGEDCIWVRNIVWIPELTCTTEAPVELSWIREKFGDEGNYRFFKVGVGMPESK